ncbi:MAG: acyloxyacyl hydrolase [Phycisphaerales bacterium]|nr:acyloxyacyl hydrolase [Phycisphaerales bacterium]
MHRMLIAAYTGIVCLLCSGAAASGGGLGVGGLTYEREWSNTSLDEVFPRHFEPFGTAGKTWWSAGGAVATTFGDETDYQIHGAFHHFLIDDLEVIGELALWYADQKGPNTYGVNPQLGLRWHFWHDEPRDWTVFAELGLGALWTEKNVPAGGTSLNFTPRGGLGFTRRIGNGPARFVAGVRHHHISNARIEGEANNPARDMPLVHFAFMFPF